MSAVTIMAALLDEELQALGIFSLSRNDCAEILRRVIDRTAEIELLACRTLIPASAAKDAPAET
jgi:hypothetical protein